MVTLGFLLPLAAMGQLRDSSRTAVNVGWVNNLTYGKLDYAATIERSVAPRISCLGSLGFNPFSRPGNYGFWRFSWTVAAEGRYYFAARNRLLNSGAYAGAYACHDRLGYFRDHTIRPSVRSRWTSIGPTIGYQQVFFQKVQVSAGIMFLFFPRETLLLYDSQGNLRRKSFYGPDYSYNYHLSIGIRL